jgi:two-component system response regulator HydG
LAQHFLDVFSEKNRKQIKGFTPQAMDRMVRYDWPGNIRALMNAVERGVILCPGEYISEEDLPIAVREAAIPPETATLEKQTGGMPLEEVEKVTILRTLEGTGGNKSETARKLGITRRTLYKKLRKYGATP